ncbi:hypothetical protein AB0C38_11330 [Amycolatopsis sp. NPDC048633]|uniref:hypothetical protein n=1 Tax=Amycolatopsis sp. NPDC048633 TaxID=3157095 RepID=UPI0033F38670
MSVLLPLLGTGLAQGSAQATVVPPGTVVDCAGITDIGWSRLYPDPAEGVLVFRGYDYTVVSTTRTFDVADSRIVYNDTDTTASGSFTATQSRTFAFTFSFGLQGPLVGKINASIGLSISLSYTTSVGVTATAPIPPHGALLGEYGVQAFDIVYHAQQFRMLIDERSGTQQRRCSAEQVIANQTAHAPTALEGWRVRNA